MSLSHGTAKHGFERPQALHNSKSFSRIEPKTSSPLRSRATTLSHTNESGSLDIDAPDIMTEVTSRLEKDVFEKAQTTGNAIEGAQPLSPQEFPEGFDDLPIELISLIDRYNRSRDSLLLMLINAI